ncbi:AAA-like domain-containing protein [Aeromonas veronii]|uniref:AAA-like domain-containing protein n=1 Tax=Aeromonas veronii TaxID=654 RepID=UPI0003A1FD34
MTKVLWPRTIIPTELYVERKADKQLAQIISDMGRPGYILVARQMGKTNLLINAKRKHSNEDNIIVYIDLSNRYDTDRQCFRSIIDTIISTNEDKFEHLIEKIQNDRETKKIPAYSEHSAELRLVLNNINGKLIIILDEIDSLTAANYSDKIFAQIRSVYFERVNFNCLERLTYVLSGVAEPSDIIKDKSISPFNIGQRIVLGDFDHIEFCDFISKTNIEISTAVSERIFNWTNGNPRMVWDICSEVEDMLLSHKTVTPESVDDIVERLYLTNFDVPPIDHIRNLVESNQELRDGIIAILYDKTETISDEVKSKLYLSGILDSIFSEGIIKIKNKVIERSLDENWLQSINLKVSYSITNAEKAFLENNYEVAIEQYSHLLMSGELNDIDTQTAIYGLACSYFNTRDYGRAIEHFDMYAFDKKNHKAIYIAGSYLKCISQLAINKDIHVAFSTLKDIFKSTDTTDNYHWLASINIVSTILQYKNEFDQKDAVETLNYIIQNKDNIGSKNILSIAYLMAGNIEEDSEQALALYLLSATHAEGLDKVKPCMNAIKINNSLDIYTQVSQLLIDNPDSNRLTLQNTSNTFDIETLFDYIEYSLENNHKELLFSVFDSFIRKEKEDENSIYIFSKLILVYVTLTSKKEHNATLCEYLLSKGRSYIPPEIIFGAAKRLLFLKHNNSEAEEIYFSGFQNYVEEKPDTIDIINFENKMSECIKAKDASKALNYSTQILYKAQNLDEKEQVRLLIIHYLRLIASDRDGRIKLYGKVMSLLSIAENNEINGRFFKPGVLKEMRNQLTMIYKSSALILSELNQSKIGRNTTIYVVYDDGTVMTGKFKKFQEEIANGTCLIIPD